LIPITALYIIIKFIVVYYIIYIAPYAELQMI